MFIYKRKPITIPVYVVLKETNKQMINTFIYVCIYL